MAEQIEISPVVVPDVKRIVRMQCDACGSGEMRPTNTVFTTDPAQYEHRCTACGKTNAYPKNYPYVTFHKAADIPTLSGADDALHQRNLLGEALGKVLVAAGMIRPDVDLTGPELLLAADTFCNPGVDLYAGVRLQALPRVARDDGRFYVPVERCAIRVNDTRSQTVLRVASDAFDTVEEAEAFAGAVAEAWNAARRIRD